MPDILFILVLALIIFGPKKLPEVMRQVAKFMAQFRMMRDDLKRQIEGEMLKIELEERQKQKVAAAPPAPQLPAADALASTQGQPVPQNSPVTEVPLDGKISAAG
jgi:sec-independent protein translocase protein TatB